MDSKDIQEKLQKAYHSMLEHVEELVEKDKKPLKEAFVEAEEKLSEWRELSREEVEHISAELKSNLSEWGETTNRLNESLKETLSFDAAYIANNIWDKLSTVADKAIVELNEFGESLQQHMATDASTFSEQQQIWFDDAKQWQSDYATALTQLDELRAGVRKQQRKIQSYAKTLSTEEAKREEHDLLAQMSQEISGSIDKVYQKLIGDES